MADVSAQEATAYIELQMTLQHIIAILLRLSHSCKVLSTSNQETPSILLPDHQLYAADIRTHQVNVPSPVVKYTTAGWTQIILTLDCISSVALAAYLHYNSKMRKGL